MNERSVVAVGVIAPPILAHLRFRGVALRDARTMEEALDASHDLVLLGSPLASSVGAVTWVERFRERDEVTPIFVVGDDASVEAVLRERQLPRVEAFPERTEPSAIVAAWEALREATPDEPARSIDEASLAALVGDSPGIVKVRALLSRLAERSAAAPTVLFTGETGVGKGLVARALHYAGGRREAPFIDVNCAAIPASLIESELFGHARGTFTGAGGDRPGLFETAHGGTLFLDEIGSMPLPLQSVLLKVIDEKRVRRLGDRVGRAIDVQIFAATHEDLTEAVRNGRFRADLLHRLDVVRVALPPLRERGEDRVMLAEAFLEAACRSYGLPRRVLAEDAKEALRVHEFPGNVRELRNVIERAVLLEAELEVRAEHLALPAQTRVAVEAMGDELQVVLPNASFSLEALEAATLRAALAKHAGNVSRAARYLRIGRQKLLYRMRKHGLR
ncbi:MAG: sigma-54-dependent Fis family transcriptional regulator [Myxococcales bacterium]|nr:sigma-54-dependent Fis family transcriptional regulator [Myxococcales bacterium]